MKGWTLRVLGTLLVLTLAGSLRAESGEIRLEGTVSGAVCGTLEHMLCTHKPDPEHHYELLGLFTKDGKFFFLINVPQKILRKVNRDPVVVKGRPVEGYPALMVTTLTTEGRTVFATGATPMKMDDDEYHEKYEKKDAYDD